MRGGAGAAGGGPAGWTMQRHFHAFVCMERPLGQAAGGAPASSLRPGSRSCPPACPSPLPLPRHVVTIDGYEDVPPNDADSLRKALAHQPVSVAICASPAMQVRRAGRGGEGPGPARCRDATARRRLGRRAAHGPCRWA